MFEYEGFEYTLDEVTAASENEGISVDEYVNKYGLKSVQATEEKTDPEQGKTNGAIETDAAVAPVATPSRASVVAGVQPKSTELDLVDTSSELEEPKPRRGRAQVRKEELEKREKAIKLSAEPKFDDFDAVEELKTSGSLFKANLKRVGANLAEIPAFVNRIKFSVGKAFLSDEDKEKINQLTPEEQDRIAQAFGGVGISGATNLGALAKPGQKAAANLRLQAEKLEENLKVYDNTITDAIFKEGDVTEGVTRLVTQGIGTIPSIMQAMIPYVGIPSIVAGSAAEASREAVYDEGKDIDLKQQLYSAGIGASEGLLEIVTKKIGKSAFKGLIGKPKEVVKKTLLQTGTGIVKAGGAEGLSETGTLAINKFLESKYFNEKGLFDMDEQKWDEFWDEAGDTFLIGMTTGKGMAGTGATAVGVRDAIGNRSVRKELNKTNINEVSEAFIDDSVDNDVVNLARNNFSERVLDVELNKKVNLGKLTKEKANEIKNNFNSAKAAVTLADNLNINDALVNETVSLVQERNKVSKKIKQAGENKALVDTDVKRLAEIDNRLSEISAENQLSITTKAVTDIVSGLEGLTIEIAENQEQADKIAEDKKLEKKTSTQQGFILQDPETGEQTIVINKEIAKKEKAVNVAAHELLHGVLFKTVKDSPETAVNLGKSLLDEINKIDADKVKDSGFKKRLELYSADPESVKMEEALTLFSDAIATGDITFEENIFTKIGDQIRRIMQGLGVNVKFNTGKDVYNFVKDYNKNIQKGALTKTQIKAAKEGVKGKLVKDEIKEAETIIKESRSDEASQRVQEIYEEQGEAGAFDIIEQFKPITSKLVERRKEAPGFNREDLTSEIELGPRGILDLIKEYNPDSGVPLAAYINKFLPARAIEASKRVLGEEFTEDVTEAKGVVAEEVSTVETPTKPEAKAIDPFRIMPDIKETATAEVQKSIADKGVDVTTVTYKELKDVAPYQTVADFFNIPVSRISNPKDNLRKSDDVANIQRWILKNEPTLKNLFTEANRDVVEIKEGDRVMRKGGEPTAIPRNLLNTFYTKGARVGNNFQWTLKPYDRTTFLEAVGIKDGKVDPDFTPRAAEAQTIKGILDMYTRNLGNVIARETIEAREDIAPAEKARVKAEIAKGKPRLMFSQNIDSNVEDDRFSQIYFAYERGETLSDKDKQIVEDYIAKQALEESDKGKSALQFTKAMKASDLSSDLKKGTWTLSDKKFKEDQNALKEFDKQADNLSSQIPLIANIANKNRNIVLGLFAGHYNIVGSDMAKIGSDFKQGVLSNLNTDESSVLSEDTLKRWRNFPWDDLKSSYASENYTGLRKINESNSFKEQQAIARETFNTKQGKASLELYDLWNTTLQEWLYSSEPGSKEFNDKANYILKLKKSNASIGTTGERILAPPGYVFLPGKAINGTVKFEHLKSSSQQSSESALLVLQNKWKDKGEDNIKAYNGIWGLLDDFNIIDEQTGKVNDSSIFRFAENLELAKSIYSVESNFTKTLYDDIVKKVGEKSVKQFESDQNKLFNANNNKLPITVKLSKSKGTPEVLKTMEDLDAKAKDANKAYFDSADLDKGFNDILEQTTGIASEKRYKRVKAEVAGAARGRVFRGIPYSAQDLVGLLYETLSKGKLGDAQMAWWTENLLKPYAKAMNDIDASRLAMMDDYRALKKELKLVPKDLRKKIPGEPFTREQAVRVYIWNQQGMEVPGISEADLKDLTNYVDGDRELQVFANQLIAMQKGDEYAKPKEGWPSGSITTDLLESINTVKRAKYLEQWQANVDVMFSEENMNKLEAAYGQKYRKAMENMLQRMKTGRNRSFSDDSLTGRFTDWLQGSVGAIMFFNTRSAVLQTLSSINFINFTDNNPLAAAKAFGNQKQYWSDVVTLINSDFLKARRSGLKINVNEADIADMAKQGGPRAVINKLLQLGFAPTQVADSFAIASGGATFYRNRIKTYKKQGLSQAEAETKAFEDFRENAEESQQSSRPDKISMQQAGGLGRLILAFQNTPSQYARIIDKSIRDLKNGRGDAKTNISKIVYYSTVQNLLFNALQQALFAFAFDEEEPEDKDKKEKYIGIANGMMDSLLRGTGLAGGVLSVGKNAILRIVKESEKDRPNYEKVGADLLKIAPPVSSKLSKINQAARSYKWDKDEMMEKGWSLDNPAYLAGANVVSALTNVPLDRAVKKANNVAAATDSDLETWERLALLGGWQDWEIGIDKETKQNKPQPRKSSIRKSKFKKSKIK